MCLPCQPSYAISLWASGPLMPRHQTSTSMICPQVFLCMLQCRVHPRGMNPPIKKSRTPLHCPPSSLPMPQHTWQQRATGPGGYAHHHRRLLPKSDFTKGGSGARLAQSKASWRQRPRSERRPGGLPSSPGGAWGSSRESCVRRRYLWAENPGRSSAPTRRCGFARIPAVHDDLGGLQPPPVLARSPRDRLGEGGRRRVERL